MKHSHTRPAFLILVILLLAALAASCVMPVPPSETPVPGATMTPKPVYGDPGEIQAFCSDYSKRGKEKQTEIPEPSPKAAELAGLSVEELPRMQRAPFQELIYVEGQILLTGQQDAIAKVSDVFSMTLGYGETPPITLDEGRSIRLATIGDGRSVEEVACLFTKYVEANPDLDAFADPNYYMSPAGWQGGGSPWTQNGFWATNEPGGGLGQAKRAQFLSQWALGSEGISLLDNGARAVDPTGKGVTIAVLDTSPWKQRCSGGWPCSMEVSLESLTGSLLGEPAAGAPDMTVWELQPGNSSTCPGQDSWNEELDREAQNINNHGLFAASLAHAVAPQSKIHLLRVLEDDGCGDLFKVLQGLDTFEKMTTDAALTENQDTQLPLANTVVNLSLGVHRPDNADELALPPEVTALRDKLQHMIRQGAVVVAATGNDSFSADPAATSPGDADAPLNAEIPAGDDLVIGVAASSYDKQRGCFSNTGDVAAPGGNGLTLAQVPPNASLAAAAAAGDFVNCIVPGRVDPTSSDYWCEQAGNENYCLVGLGIDPKTKAPRYLYWAGTSFATPLVSGIAALKLEVGVPPDQVDDEIYASVDPATAGTPFLGAGIANAAN